MEIYEYDFDEIEDMADAENLRYDPTRLTELKPMDAYDYAEKMHGMNFDWKYISYNCFPPSVLYYTNANAWFSSCYIPKGKAEKMTATEVIEVCTPYKQSVRAKTIIIDQSILDRGMDYEEKFCIVHECGHYLCHPKGFDVASCEGYEPYIYGSMVKMTPQQKHERHANQFAAALLMPRYIVAKTFNELMESTMFAEYSRNDKIRGIIEIMAKMCNTTPQSMSYRLNDLNNNTDLLITNDELAI